MVPSGQLNDNEKIKFNLLEDYFIQTPANSRDKFLCLIDAPTSKIINGKHMKCISVGCDYAEPGAEKTVYHTAPKNIVKPGED